MRTLHLAFLLSLVWSIRAESQAELWLVVANSSGSVTSIDSLSIKVVGTDLVELRLRRQFSPPRESSRGRYDFIRFDSEISRERIHCTKLRSMQLEISLFLGTIQVQRNSGSVGRRTWGQPFREAEQRLAGRVCGIAFGRRTPAPP